jgi:hypothetical protein
VDVRIGVTYSTKELEVELDQEADRDDLKARVDRALAGDGPLWLVDRRGREIAVPSDKVAYVEIGSPEDAHRIGFGS